MNQHRLVKMFVLLALLACEGVRASTPISGARGQARRPQIAYSDGIVHVVDFEDQDIVYYRSTDRGRTFSAPVYLGDAATDWNPVLCAAHNFVYVAWWSDRSANDIFEVYFARSTDGGASFEAPQLLSLDDRKSSYVSGIDTSADGSRVVVAYWDLRTIGGAAHSNVMTRTSNAFGSAGSWGPEI